RTMLDSDKKFRNIYYLTPRSTPPVMDGSRAPFTCVRTTDFSADDNAALYDKIALTPLENHLIEALHVIDNRITGINFLKDQYVSDDKRVPFVVLDGKSEKYRLSTMGDGVNRILTIILAMLNSRGGILLIDEFENGLHYSVQQSLWGLIERLARELDIQVFATTHSDDCIKAFLSATIQSGDSRVIRLENRKAGEIAVVYADADELGFIKDNGIEVR
ncbi:MAG: ATP-binding protein, partial [Duncaniella sp.]|nr:ATP-binding protein [Duncaniella sp.]